MRFLPVLFSLLVYATTGWASGPAGGAVQGTLIGPSGAAITNPSVDFSIQILDAAGTCVMYQEEHLNVDLSTTNGDFSLNLGEGVNAQNFVQGTAVLTDNIFRNDTNLGAFAGCGGGLTFLPGDGRRVRVRFDVGGGYVLLTPDLEVQSSPYAVVANSADKIQGKSMDLSSVSSTAGDKFAMLWDQALNRWVPRQINVGDIGSAAGQYFTYMPNNVACGVGQVLKWTASNRWECAADDTGGGGGVTLVALGSGLVGGNITGAGTISVNVGTGANQIVQLNGSSQLPAVSGALLTNVNATYLQGNLVSAAAPGAQQVLKWNGSAWTPSADADSGGDITSVYAGTGLTGGALFGDATLNVDVGINANQIPQLKTNGALGIGTATPTSGAIADFYGATALDSAVVVPRATTGTRPASPVNGMIRYNTSLAKFEVYENGGWYNMVNTGGIGDFLRNGTLPMTGNFRAGSQWISNDGDNEGLRIDNSGNVGIGTTSPNPNAILDVNGIGNVSAMIVPRDTQAARPVTATNGMIRYNTNTSKFEVYAASNWADLATGGSSQWTDGAGGDIYYNGGSVGIGITSPTAAFEIDHGTNTGRAAYIHNSTGATANNPLVGLYTSNAAFDQPALDITYNGTTEAFGVYNGGSSSGIYVSQSGINRGLYTYSNVGATAISPLVEFQANNAAFDQTALLINNFGTGSSLVVNDASGDTTPFIIDASGNVGIGTNNPLVPLYVKGAGVSVGGTIMAISSFEAAPGNDEGVFLGYNSAGGVKLGYIGAANSGAADPAELAFVTDGGSGFSEHMRISSSGNVGIGTPAPNTAAILDVNGTGNLSAMIVPRATTAERPVTAANGMIRYNTNLARFEVYQNNGWTQLMTGSGAAGDFLANGTVPMTGNVRLNGNWLSNDGGNEGIRVDNNGLVGIGTSTFVDALTVVGSTTDVLHLKNTNNANTTSIDFSDDGGNQQIFFGWGNTGSGAFADTAFWGTNNAKPLVMMTNSLERMRVENNGRVGIGTASPNAAAVLDVNGTGNLSAMIVPRATTAERPVTAANGMIRYNTSLSKFEVYQSNIWTQLMTGSGAAGDFMANGSVPMTGNLRLNGNWLSNDGGTEGLRVDDNGHVGVGAPADTNNILYVEQTKSSTASGWQIGSRGLLVAAPGSASASDFIGLQSQVEQTNNTNVTGSFVGLHGITAKGGSGTLGRSVGVSGYPINVAGNTSIAAAFSASAQTDAGTITEYRAFESAAVYMPGGSITTAYGLWLDDLNGPGTVYGIYQTGQSDTNYLSGRTGIGNALPQAGTALDVTGTGVNFSSMLVPRDSTANRPTGVNGMIRYNTNLAAFEVYANSQWVNLATGSGTSQWTTGGGGIYYASGNVGIGTNSAGSRLTLSEALPGTSGDQQASYFESYTSAAGASTAVSRGIHSYLYFNGGTNSPSARVEAGRFQADNQVPRTVGTVTGISSVADNGSTGTITSANAAEFEVYNTGGGTITTGIGVYIGSIAGTTKYSLYAGDSTAQSYFAGRVGIGTALPHSATILDINGTGNLSAMIVPRATTGERPVTAANGMIRYNTNTSKFEVYSAGNWADLATGSGSSQWTTTGSDIYYGSGNIGVGTSTVGDKVTVRGTDQDVFAHLTLSNPTVSRGVGFLATAYKNATASEPVFQGTTYRGNSGAPAAVQSGDVLLNIQGVGGNGSGYNSNTGARIVMTAEETFNAGSAASSISFRTAATGESSSSERMRIMPSGRVGIGSLSPSQALHVVGNFELEDNNPKFVFDDNNGNDFYIQNVNGNLRFSRNDDSTVNFIIEQLGQIGIGTSTPNSAAVLDVNGTGNLSAMIVPRATTGERPVTAANGMIRYNTNLSAFEVYANNQWVTMATGATGASQWTTGGGGIYYDSGDVGIGTTNPMVRLDVYADTPNPDGVYIFNNNSDPAAEAFLQVESNSSGIYLTAGDDKALLQGSSSNGLDVQSYAGPIKLSTEVILGSPVERMRINTNGSVGVGTNAPNTGSILDIHGTGNLSSLLVPRDSTAARAGIGVNGMIRYNTNISKFEVYQNSGWASVTTSPTDGPLHLTGFNSWTTSGWARSLIVDAPGDVPAIQLGYGSGNRWGIGNNDNLAIFKTTVDDNSAGLSYVFYADGTTNNLTLGGYGSGASPVNIDGGMSVGSGYIASPAPTDGAIIQGSVGIGTTSASSTLTVNGSLARNLVTVTAASYTVAATDTHIIANRAGTVTLTLPAAASFAGREISIRTIQAQTVVSASSNVVPLAGGAAGTAILANTAGRWAVLVSDGTNWQIQMGN